MKTILASTVMILLISSIFIPISSQNPYINRFSDHMDKGYTFKDNMMWSGVKRLTWFGNASDPVILSDDNGNYDVVWADNRYGNWDIYYLKITVNGFKLVNDTRITSYSGKDIKPSAAEYGDNICIVWQRLINGIWSIYYARIYYGPDNISIEVPPKPIHTGKYNSTNPKIAVDTRGFVFVVWQEYTGTNWDIFYQKFDLNGNPVFAPINVSRDPSNSTDPALSIVSNQTVTYVHIMWLDDSTTPGYSIFYRKLDCCGYFLTPPRRLSVVSPKTMVDLQATENSIYTVFSCARENSSYEIIYTLLNSSGITLIDDTNLTPLDGIDSTYPHIAFYQDRIFLTYADLGTESVKFALYTTSGKITGSIFNVSSAQSFTPDIAVSEKSAGIVWVEEINSTMFLFFRSAVFPDIKVKNINLKLNENRANITVNISSDFNMNTYVNCMILVDNDSFYSNAVYITNSATVNASINVSGGDHILTVIVDPEHNIIDANFTNNIANKTFFVSVYSFRLYAPSAISLSAGNYTEVSAILINTGNMKDSYSVHIVSNSTEVLVSPTWMNISLSPEQNSFLNFTVYSKLSSTPGAHNLTVVIISAGSAKLLSENITVIITPLIQFSLEYQSIYYFKPGTFGNITLKIKNIGTVNDTYRIYAFQELNWPMEISNTSENITPCNYKLINVRLLVPNGIAAYSKNIIQITVISNTTGIIKNATVLIIVAPMKSAYAYIVSTSKNGSIYYINIRVRNTGNIAEVVNIHCSGNFSDYAYISPASTLLEPEQWGNISISLYIPENTLAGAYPVYIKGYCGDNETLFSLSVNVVVEPVHRYTVEIERVSSKNSISFDMKIRNQGNVMEVFTIMAVLKSKNITWVLRVNNLNYTNETTITVEPNSTVNIVIYPKTQLPNGKYTLIIHIISGEGVSKNSTIPFEISSKGGFDIVSFFFDNLIYITILAVAIGGLVAFIRKRD